MHCTNTKAKALCLPERCEADSRQANCLPACRPLHPAAPPPTLQRLPLRESLISRSLARSQQRMSRDHKHQSSFRLVLFVCQLVCLFSYIHRDVSRSQTHSLARSCIYLTKSRRQQRRRLTERHCHKTVAHCLPLAGFYGPSGEKDGKNLGRNLEAQLRSMFHSLALRLAKPSASQ